MSCPKSPSGRTFSGDYGYWSSKHHDQFYDILGFVISMFCWRQLEIRETVSLHIWWQRQVAGG